MIDPKNTGSSESDPNTSKGMYGMHGQLKLPCLLHGGPLSRIHKHILMNWQSATDIEWYARECQYLKRYLYF